MTANNNNKWATFWKQNPSGFDQVMLEATKEFSKRLSEKNLINHNDVILDYGCGLGFFIENLSPDKAKKICGVDISEFYINKCREKFSDSDKYRFEVINSEDFNLLKELIKQEKANKVIILSVLQYFQNENKVKALLDSLLNLNVEIDCIIADIISIENNALKDVYSVFVQSLKNNYFISFLKFIKYVFLSDYSQVKKVGFLKMDKVFFNKYAAENNLVIRYFDNLTIHESRYSVLIEFGKTKEAV